VPSKAPPTAAPSATEPVPERSAPAPRGAAKSAAAKPAPPASAAAPATEEARRERARAEVKKLVAEKSRASSGRAASSAPQTYARTPDADVGDFPDVTLNSVRWHPDAERRVAEVDLPQVGPLEIHEGDIVSGVLVVRIDPGAIELQVGSAHRRVTIGP
jgi:hypothetical protein